ncbi:PE family protein [Mycobacterium sp. 050134]|uniref:PE family protein n=1 Tax=Mycobacterium sp. 050134 TaxID=3096111 RepID=UPI002ED9FA1E
MCSSRVAALFDAQGQAYQALSAEAAAFHLRVVQLVAAGANAYANAEVNVVQSLGNVAP